MSYTPTTWTTGDTITASAMNKIEQGIADAGGGGTCFFVATTRNFPTSSNWVGSFVYLVYDDGSYEEISNYLSSPPSTVNVYGNTTGIWFSSMPIPTLENYYLAFLPGSGVTVASVSGGIEDTPVVVDGYNNYIIHGDFIIELEGWN